MPRRRNPSSSSEQGSSEYIRLEQRLVLLAWMNDLFGYGSNRELLADMKEAAEGFDASGRSYIYHRLIARGNKVRIRPEKLAEYDDNVRDHLTAINARRPEPITLRYFQHLALLYTEIFLDWRFNHPTALLRALNTFVRERNFRRLPSEIMDPEFNENDLNKLAYWMATGSGKTLIMHINYRQFLHYNKNPLDNILLITPKEELSQQHMQEMTASNIPCRRFDLNESGPGFPEEHTVRVIEITKLVEEKRGGGVSVPVEAFEGNNLILVDEGHKGAGGVAWRNFRDALGHTGFTFEYSATFGQALRAAGRDQLTEEYGKAILFNYSYPYFYGDGFGKDFHVLNLREETTEDRTETLLLGNLLSFYEQQRVFQEQFESLRPYNLEKPLWVFVGSSVNAVYKEGGRERSDVLTVARFLHHVLANRNGWAIKTIAKLLEWNSGLVTPDGRDIFEGKFAYLRQIGLTPEQLFRDLLSSVFHTHTGGGLHLVDIRGVAGELGLKASGAHGYFGIIYIGDTSKFKKLVEEDDSGILLEEDAITGSLFGGINEPDTSINILIGAKKFMEGWNSWRVSNMGLLNIGRRAGPEIIQLFGRGVRLRGKDFTLKRSAALDGNHPSHLVLLETLNIFAVRANYMANFREYLEKEGMEIEGMVELPLAIRPNQEFLGKDLVVPRIPENRSFLEEARIFLKPDPQICVRVDMSHKVQVLESGTDGITTMVARAGKEQVIPAESLALVNWEEAYLELLSYKERKGFTNLVIQPDTLKNIISTTQPNRLYSLIADESVVRPSKFDQWKRLQEAVQFILRNYVDKFYRVQKERWDTNQMVYKVLDANDPNFQDYTLKIPRSDRELIRAVQRLIEDADRLYNQESQELPRIHFDRHLYQPLLVERGTGLKSIPPGLKESERKFVEDLRTYCREEMDKSLATKEVFLLRNLTRGKGIGFFEKRGFYPDFILWIKDSESQRIVFIEPHGMLHAQAYQHDDKARLHEYLPVLVEQMRARGELENVTLNSFIISVTPFNELRQKYDDGTWDLNRFAEAHILFMEQSDYIITMMEMILSE